VLHELSHAKGVIVTHGRMASSGPADSFCQFQQGRPDLVLEILFN
jgi:hypothetical protein